MARSVSHRSSGFRPVSRPDGAEALRPAISLVPWILLAAMSLPARQAFRAVIRPLHDHLQRASLSTGQMNAQIDRPSSALKVFTPEVQRWGIAIQRWSQAYRLPQQLIATVMQIESCGDPAAISLAGARGLFQVMPYHFEPTEDPLHPETNARRGLVYLAGALEKAQGEIDLALAAYNGGHSVIDRPQASWPDETQRYVAWGGAIYRESRSGSSSSRTLSQWLLAGGSQLCQAASLYPGQGEAAPTLLRIP